MIEVQYQCEVCKQPFIRAATTEDEIQVLQKSIWMFLVCDRCRMQDCYWDE